MHRTRSGEETAPAHPPERTPSQRRFILRVSLVAAIGGLLFGYDTGVLSGALVFMDIGTGPATVDGANLTPFEQGWITSSLLLAAAVGALGGGRVADRIGRRRSMLAAGVVFSIAAVVTALAPDVAIMILGRVLLGLAVGAASITVPMYIAEIVPADLRGRLVTVNSLMIVTGQLLAYSVNASIAWTQDWRLMLLLAGAPSLALVLGMIVVPDSPRSYVLRGRRRRAQEVLTAIYDEPTATSEIQVITASVEKAKHERVRLRELLTPWVRHVVVIGIGIAALQQITGVNSIVYFAPVVLSLTGLDGETALIASIGVGVAAVIATFIGLFLIDRFPRRTVLLTGQVVVLVCLVLLSFAIGQTGIAVVDGQPVPAAEPDLTWSWLTLGAMLLFITAQNASVSPIVWLLLAEIFPQRYRGLGMGIAGFVLWLVNFAVGLLFIPAIGAVGAQATFLLFAGLGLLGIVFAVRWVPETRGRSLAEIEADWRRKAGVHEPVP